MIFFNKKSIVFKFALLFLAILLLNCFHQIYAEKELNVEYQVKATFIYKFLNFIERKDNNFSKEKLSFCIIGDDHFGSILDSSDSFNFSNKVLIPKNVRSVQDGEMCDIIFISSSEKKRLKDIIGDLNGRNVLTIGDTKGYAKDGVMINFYIKNNKVRFEVNVKAAKRNGIEISSKLLRLAKLVD